MMQLFTRHQKISRKMKGELPANAVMRKRAAKNFFISQAQYFWRQSFIIEQSY
jgi:hypothetical protein